MLCKDVRTHLPRLRQQPAACSVLILALALLATVSSATMCAPPDSGSPPASFCQHLEQVCLDQNVFVHYASSANPRSRLYQAVPQLQLQGIHADLHGFGDQWGTEQPYPQPLHRPATTGEETRELDHPQFSRCSLPLLVYPAYLYSRQEFFIRTVATLHAMVQKGWMDRRMSLVVATLGQRLHGWHLHVLRPFSRWEPTTLSHLSARLPQDTPEPYNPEGVHGRCFRSMLVCQTSHFADLGLRNPVWSTGQYILDHHRQHLPSLEALDAYRNFTAPGKLRVLIVARHHRSRVRQLLNQQQVWSWCTKFRPAAGVLAKVPAWNGTSCLLHQPGADHLLDTALAAQADVMVGVHGAGLLDALYMRPGSSVVEVRPRGFAGAWPNAYLKDLLGSYDDHPLFWWGINIVQPEASKPGELEQQQRGAPDTWPRDRHVTLRLMALQYIFERIVLARRDRGVYLQLRKQRETYITDDMRNLGEDD